MFDAVLVGCCEVGRVGGAVLNAAVVDVVVVGLDGIGGAGCMRDHLLVTHLLVESSAK